MKKVVAFSLVGLVLLAGGSKPALAVTFTGIFSGSDESPPVDSPGRGKAEVELDPVLHELRIDVTFSGLLSPTTVAHIHCCTPPGMSIGVATMTPTFTGFPAGVTSGTYQATFDTTMVSTFNAAFVAANGGTAAGAEAALLEGLLNRMAYFNIHTEMFASGEIRANLAQAIVPTPALTPWALGVAAGLLLAVTAVALRRRRRISRLAAIE